MRFLCPSCLKSVEFADTEAGKTVACSHCGHSFTAPQMYAAPTPEPVPVSPSLLPAPTPEPAPAPKLEEPVVVASSTPSLPGLGGYHRVHSLPLNRRVCECLVLASLTLIFFLTFFKWDGLYPAGYAAYTQNAWQSLFASMSVDPVSEMELKLEPLLNERLRPTMLLLLYLFLVIAAVALIWAETVVKAFHLKLPVVAQRFWSYRPTAISVCAGLSVLLLLIQSGMGFGLERALEDSVEASFKEQRDAAKTPEQTQRVEMKIAEESGRYHLRTTNALRLTFICHFLALAAIIGETVLIHRGSKVPPRVGVMW